MKTQQFIDYLNEKTRIYKGKKGHYSKYSINLRVSHLLKLQEYFGIDIDDKCLDKKTGVEFLKEIRNAQIEDLAHTPLSNAFRHYFEFYTGKYIEKIF